MSNFCEKVNGCAECCSELARIVASPSEGDSMPQLSKTGILLLGLVENMARLRAYAVHVPRSSCRPYMLLLQTGIPVLGVVENMAGLRQRADAFRFTLPGAGSGNANGGSQRTDSSAGGSATAEERDVTEQVLAALRQIAPDLEVRGST